MMKNRLVTTLQILRQTPETTLAYLYGVGLMKGSVIFRLATPRSIASGILRFLRFLYANMDTCEKVSCSSGPLLLFAGTRNQFLSLLPTMKALTDRKVAFNLVLGKSVATVPSGYHNYIRVRFSVMDALCALSIFTFRGPQLWFSSLFDRDSPIRAYSDVFFQCHAFLPYFLKLIMAARPRYIIVSNDHNLENRCLLQAASACKIKTIYMQHGSVTSVLPPLSFNYAFLDGLESFHTYTKIKDKASSEAKKQSESCVILLTGIQKSITAAPSQCERSNFTVGLGINTLDNLDKVVSVARTLISAGLDCCIRTHPGQSEATREIIKGLAIDENNKITWSDGRHEDVGLFFARINSLIACNTSLHLEGALAGVPTFYLDLSDAKEIDDYYEFVKKGVAIRLTMEDLEGEANILKRQLSKIALNRNLALQHFSESYGTSYNGKEGECVARAVIQLLNDEPIHFPYVLINSKEKHNTLYRLSANLTNL